MKLATYLLQLMGFDGVPDFFGKYYPLTSFILQLSIPLGMVSAFIENHSGISMFLWLFFIAGTMIDLGVGLYTNVVFLKQDFETDRFFRGILKPFVMCMVIFLTNYFKIGIERTPITPELIKTTAVFTASSIHYSFTIIIGLFILLSIAENMAKLGWGPAVTLTKILNMKIKKIEDLNETDSTTNN